MPGPKLRSRIVCNSICIHNGPLPNLILVSPCFAAEVHLSNSCTSLSPCPLSIFRFAAACLRGVDAEKMERGVESAYMGPSRENGEGGSKSGTLREEAAPGA
jgi:hypothetical protein